MYEKRLKAYKAVGYTITSPEKMRPTLNGAETLLNNVRAIESEWGDLFYGRSQNN